MFDPIWYGAAKKAAEDYASDAGNANLTDSGSYFTDNTVEGALQEVGGKIHAIAPDNKVPYRSLSDILKDTLEFDDETKVLIAQAQEATTIRSVTSHRGYMVMFKPIADPIDAVQFYCATSNADIDVTMYIMSANSFASTIAQSTVHKTQTAGEWLTFIFDNLDVSDLSVVYIGVLVPLNVTLWGSYSTTFGDSTYVYTNGDGKASGAISKITNNPTEYSLLAGYVTPMNIYSGSLIPKITPDSVIATLTPTKVYAYQDSIAIEDTPAQAVFVDTLLSEYQNVLFSNGRDKQYIMPSNVTALASDTVAVNVDLTLAGDGYADKTLTVSRISTKTSVGTGAAVRLLQIGDSVTNGYASDYNYDSATETGQISWAVASVLGKKFITDYDTVAAFSSETVGINTFYAEGRGGWSLANYLYDASVSAVTNPFYDADVTWTDNDLTAAGVKFSLTKFITDGSTDTPTHVVIQLGLNDVTGAAYLTNMALMIAAIKEQYPAVIVGISLPCTYGTWFQELYPNYAFNNSPFHGATTDKLISWIPSLMAMEDTANGIYFIPTYFVTPTAEAIPTVTIDGVEVTAIFDSCFHPNHIAHLAWGKQLFAWILYTLA